MPGDDLRKRIEALNKRPLRNVPENRPSSPQPRPAEGERAEAPQPIIHSRSVPLTEPPLGVARSLSGRDFGPPVALEEAVEGMVAAAPAGPGYFLISKAAVALEAEAINLHRRFVSLTGHPDGQAVERIAAVCKRDRIAPHEVVFLDLETTGLGGTPLFLVGTMECTEDGFHFRQYFARDYSEEMSVLAAVSERLLNTHLLITFNGKSFDVPYMQNRCIATGVRLCLPPSHLDILHEARRLYGPDLPNCRLQTLEQMVCGRCRDDDIPSSEIPAVYQDFVRTGNANKISLVLLHNLYDLLTMADLMNRMWGR